MYEPKSEKYNNKKKRKKRRQNIKAKYQQRNKHQEKNLSANIYNSTKIKTLVQKYKDIKTNHSKKV